MRWLMPHGTQRPCPRAPNSICTPSAPQALDERPIACLPGSARLGGSSVTLSGRGFGKVKGSVTVGPETVQDADISAWSDTKITFTLPNMAGQSGAQDVVVHPAAGVRSNARTLTLY
jgi:hypothetical protein